MQLWPKSARFRQMASDSYQIHAEPHGPHWVAWLARTTDGSGRVRDHTLAELRALDAGTKFARRFAGARILTLDEGLRSGEVIVTEKGQARYKLTLYTPAQPRKSRGAKDYMSRLRRYQPRPISAAATKSLDDENRGER